MAVGCGPEKGNNLCSWTADANPIDNEWHYDSEDCEIRNKSNNLVVAIGQAKEGNGKKLCVWDKLGTWEQKWLMKPLIGEISHYLKLLFNCDGKTGGQYTLNVTTGWSYKSEMSSEAKANLSTHITEHLRLGLDIMPWAYTGTGEVTQQDEIDIRSSIHVEEVKEKTEALTITFDKPCYAYQAISNFECENGVILVQGALIMKEKPIGSMV